jgi:hypothetical protein
VGCKCLGQFECEFVSIVSELLDAMNRCVQPPLFHSPMKITKSLEMSQTDIDIGMVERRNKNKK